MGRGGRPRNHDEVANTIRRSIADGDDARARSLIEEKGTEILDGDARTPSLWAAFHNREPLLRWLVGRGANVNHQDRIGYCALHFAAQERHTAIAKTLLDSGASTELRDVLGNTPLWTAGFSARGDFGVFRLLLKRGAVLENRNNAGKTVRDLALTLFPEKLGTLLAEDK